MNWNSWSSSLVKSEATNVKQRNCIIHILVTHSFFIHWAHTYLSHAQSAHTLAFSQHTYTCTHLDTLQLSTGYFRTQCCWVACYTICISWTVSLKLTCFLSQWEDTSFTNRHCSLFYVLVAGSVTHSCESSLSKLSAPPVFVERPEREWTWMQKQDGRTQVRSVKHVKEFIWKKYIWSQQFFNSS